MRVILQRSGSACVTVGEDVTAEIDHGLVLLVGITHDDTMEDVIYTADKAAGLRIFEDEAGKMNVSVKETGGSVITVSQFTLYGDTRKGRRPNFMKAAPPGEAEAMYEAFNTRLRTEHGLHVETGRFGEMMDVSLTNKGPVTIIIDSSERNPS
ncbi:D-aminoacyl-tRNA deacylase [Alkalicoccus chagannorensis]|uniref:D-aminoacyl-tRNA deacylase n=1 Tax=Alkalicoccus chagannorensis TaxID=427072 RepID=UPI0003FD378C|nr:D-aminoacyl-tRNA deacylase [Alkalicoccus chagannorensis]